MHRTCAQCGGDEDHGLECRCPVGHEWCEITSTTGTTEDVRKHLARQLADISMQWGYAFSAFERAEIIDRILREGVK